MMRAGQPVTHMRSTNSKPPPSNQFPSDKIKNNFLLDIRHNREKRLSQLSFHADFNGFFPFLKLLYTF